MLVFCLCSACLLLHFASWRVFLRLVLRVTLPSIWLINTHNLLGFGMPTFKVDDESSDSEADSIPRRQQANSNPATAPEPTATPVSTRQLALRRLLRAKQARSEQATQPELASSSKNVKSQKRKLSKSGFLAVQSDGFCTWGSIPQQPQKPQQMRLESHVAYLKRCARTIKNAMSMDVSMYVGIEVGALPKHCKFSNTTAIVKACDDKTIVALQVSQAASRQAASYQAASYQQHVKDNAQRHSKVEETIYLETQPFEVLQFWGRALDAAFSCIAWRGIECFQNTKTCIDDSDSSEDCSSASSSSASSSSASISSASTSTLAGGWELTSCKVRKTKGLKVAFCLRPPKT